jgi:hypothetical protein
MGRIVDDCIVETSTTTGTGDFTLTGAVLGFRQFSSVCAVSDTFNYLIEAIDGSGNRTGEWETGFGTYSGANTLARTTVHKSSNANVAVNFGAGTKRVMIAQTADAVGFKGALAYKSANLTAQNLTSASVVTWNSEDYDTHGFHDTGVNPERLTVPTGVARKVKLSAQITLASITADLWVLLEIRKNGSAAYTGVGRATAEVGTTTPSVQVETGVVSVVAGDYFELWITVETDTSVDITAASSWFQIEAKD